MALEQHQVESRAAGPPRSVPLEQNRRRRRIACWALSGVGAAVLAVACASPAAASLTVAPSAAAAQAAATGQVCDLSVTDVDPGSGPAVTAIDLNEGGNGDEIFGRVGSTEFPFEGVVRFPTAGTARDASAFDSPRIRFFDGLATWKLVEDDILFNDVIGNKFFPCQNAAGHVIYEGAGAKYDVEIVMQVVN